MATEDVIRGLAERVSGIRILDAAAELSRFHRTPASPGFAAAVDFVRSRLAEAGVPARVYEFPADGVSATYGWTSPPAWAVRSGRLVQSGVTERRIADFADVAQCVVVHSPGGRFEAEVVHLRDGLDGDEDVRGRVALVCARASEAVARAAERGAVGVVVYPDDDRAAVSHDLVQYQSLFPRRDAIAGLVPAFSVSRRAADRLTRALARGPVTLRGEIEADFGPGNLQVVDACIPGRDRSAASVLFTAHLCHPRGSANDNASGAAALLEIARALQAAPLRGAARFLWMPEFYGTLPWAAERVETLRDVAFVLNLDMVGASPDSVGEPLRVFRAANHVPHYTNALVEPLAAVVAAQAETRSPRGSSRPLHCVLDLPSGGSDHLVFAASPHRLPALMLGQDDPHWHTDLDTPDKLDPTRLKQAAVLAAALAHYAAPDERDAEWIWGRLLEHSSRELVRAKELGDGLDVRHAAGLLNAALDIELARTSSAPAGTVARGERARILGDLRRHLGAPAPHVASEGDVARPLRQIDGPLVYTITESFSEDDRTFFKERLGANHRALAEGLLNHCDGTKTPREISLALSLDAGRVVSVDDVERGLDLFRQTGYVA